MIGVINSAPLHASSLSSISLLNISINRRSRALCSHAWCVSQKAAVMRFASSAMKRDHMCTAHLHTLDLRIGCSASCARGKCHIYITDHLEAMALHSSQYFPADLMHEPPVVMLSAVALCNCAVYVVLPQCHHDLRALCASESGEGLLFHVF